MNVRGKGSLVAAVLVVGAAALLQPSRGGGLDQTATDPNEVERGRAVYAEQKCQVCHAIAGVGNRRYPLDGVGSKLSRDDIRRWIVAPREMNPRVSKRAFDKLPAADLEALVAYLSTLQKD